MNRCHPSQRGVMRNRHTGPEEGETTEAASSAGTALPAEAAFSMPRE